MSADPQPPPRRPWPHRQLLSLLHGYAVASGFYAGGFVGWMLPALVFDFLPVPAEPEDMMRRAHLCHAAMCTLALVGALVGLSCTIRLFGRGSDL